MEYVAMDSFVEGYRTYQRSLRCRPFKTLEGAIAWATKRASGKPFVCSGCKVVWTY